MEFANCFACFNVPGTSALKVIGPATHISLAAIKGGYFTASG
ncbi:hypothetical protein ACLB1R_24640 [Escherichia coli]